LFHPTRYHFRSNKNRLVALYPTEMSVGLEEFDEEIERARLRKMSGEKWIREGTRAPKPASVQWLRRHPPTMILENLAETCYFLRVTIVPPRDLRPENRRRSKRVRARIPVMIRCQGADKHSISEKTHTMILNEHGALILLAAVVEIHQIVRLENLDRE
jgi:hypothetical protein